jgi:UDP-glucuronate decarboxylase
VHLHRRQTRSFQYVDDLIRGMVAVMDGDEIGPFNVGNPGEFTMLELANVSVALLRAVLIVARVGLHGHSACLTVCLAPCLLLCHAPRHAHHKQLVKEVINPKAQITFQENTADDPSRRRPDISRMKAKYGWEPQVPLKEGLLRMVDDFKRRLHV